MSSTPYATKFIAQEWKKVVFLLFLFLLYTVAYFGRMSWGVFHEMARWNEPFSLFSIMVKTWEHYFFLQSLLQSMVSASFWQYKICFALSLIYWWRKPTKWRSALVLFLASLSYLYCYAVALEWYGETLVEHYKYRQMLPPWFPPTPERLFSAFINLF